MQELFDYREDGEILPTEEDEYEQNQMLLTELSPGEREQVLVSAALLSRARRIEKESIPLLILPVFFVRSIVQQLRLRWIR